MVSPPVVALAAVADELGIDKTQVESVVALADEGNTVPFITRYRKERTGNLDEEQIRSVLARVMALRQLAERAGTILRLIDAQGKLTPQLRQAIEQADSLKRLEDLYLPYKPKKQTRASAARASRSFAAGSAARISLANGSSPRVRATVARVCFLGL